MTLGELLQYLRGSILNDRTDRVSGSSDYLWTDADLITNINEAQRRFATRSLILRDGTTDVVTKITLASGQDTYELHPSVISVISARKIGQQLDLTRVGHCLLNQYRQPTDNWISPQDFTALQPGPTLAYTTDEMVSSTDEGALSNVTMRVFPVPSAAEDGDELRLRVVRKPIYKFVPADLALTGDNQKSPELPEDHHIEMLDWAAYLSLRIVDDDAGAPKRAAEFAQSFEAHVVAARTLAMRKMFAPQGWGFGRGGFSWSN